MNSVAEANSFAQSLPEDQSGEGDEYRVDGETRG